MSAVGGILMFDRAPVDQGALASLGARLERLGPDGGREVIAGSVGMTYRAFHTNAESRRERQPYCRGQQAVLCFDGRLDNREELLRELRDDLRGDDTDAAIVMAAFLKWRVKGIAKLVGDFALAIWDRRDGAVWLARDCAGARTLYYHVSSRRAIWSTDLGVLLQSSGATPTVDEEYVAGFIARGPDPGVTPYVGLCAVKPAYIVRIDVHGRTSEHQYWEIDPGREIRYRADDEYEEHFRAAFREAVRVRLRSDRTVMAELSGGLDSSSIVCMADDVLADGAAAAPRLDTLSYVFDDDSRADERKFIAHVEARRGRPGRHLRDRDHPFFSPATDPSLAAKPNWVLFSAALHYGVLGALQHANARVVLSGHGGDHLLLSARDPGPHLSSLLRARAFQTLYRSARQWAPVLRQPYTHVLWNYAVCPQLPPRIRSSVLKSPAARLPEWLNPRFVQARGLKARRFGEERAGRHPLHRRALVALFETAVQQMEARPRQELGGADVVFPFLHRPLVEFLLAIPFEQKLRPDQNRSVMRRALRALLPDPILARGGKGDPSGTIFRGLREHHGYLASCISDGLVVRRGYVDEHRFAAALKRAAAGRESHSGTLMRVIVLELWLRLLEGTGPPDIAWTGEPAASSAAIA